MAAAARPLTVLHVPEPGAVLGEPGLLTACCGQPMDPGDLWTAVEAQPGDRVCPGAATQEGIF